jgi:DNA-binding response OmpR family regulator
VLADDPDIRDFVTYSLRRAGLSVTLKSDLRAIIEGWPESGANLIVVQSSAPANLTAQIKELRRSVSVPLILLLEAPRESRIAGLLNVGADLVLPLPVGPTILAAYSHSLLRRGGRRLSFALPVLDLGEVALDPSTREVKVDDNPPKRLTQMEFRLLYLLMTHRGEVLPTEVIVDHIWGYSEPSSRELVRGLVSRLRTKVEREPPSRKFIHTISGVGYLFDIEPR